MKSFTCFSGRAVTHRLLTNRAQRPPLPCRGGADPFGSAAAQPSLGLEGTVRAFQVDLNAASAAPRAWLHATGWPPRAGARGSRRCRAGAVLGRNLAPGAAVCQAAGNASCRGRAAVAAGRDPRRWPGECSRGGAGRGRCQAVAVPGRGVSQAGSVSLLGSASGDGRRHPACRLQSLSPRGNGGRRALRRRWPGVVGALAAELKRRSVCRWARRGGATVPGQGRAVAGPPAPPAALPGWRLLCRCR